MAIKVHGVSMHTTNHLAWAAILVVLAVIYGGSAATRAQSAAAGGSRPRQRTVVTAEEFDEALREGVLHIVVGAHLDLTVINGTLEIEAKGYDFDKPLFKLNGTASIRGACEGVPAPAGQLEPPLQSAAACHILVKEDFMALRSDSSSLLWLHDLYLEVDRRTQRPPSQVAMLFQTRSTDIWATQCVFRGDGTNSRFLEAGSGRQLYLRDVTVTEFRQFVHPGVRLYQAAVATLLRVTVRNNVAEKVSNSVLSELHNGPVLGMISGNLRRARAWMYDCTLTDNTAAAAPGVEASSDNERNSVYSNTGVPLVWVKLPGLESKFAQPREMTAEAFADGSVQFFPSERDPKFRALISEEYQVTGLPAIETAVLPAPGSAEFSAVAAPAPLPVPGGGSSSTGAGAIIGGCVAAAVLVAVLAAVLLLRRRRRRQRKPVNSKPGSPEAVSHDQPLAPRLAPMLGAPQTTGPSGPLIRAHSHSVGTDGLTAFSRSTGGTTTAVVPAAMPVDRGDGRGPAADEGVEDILDGMHARGEVLMGVYEFLGGASRRRGGQGVVQFARRTQNGAEHAIKFFTDRRAFSRELELYKNPTLRAMMPAVSAVQDNSDGRIQDGTGTPLPPFIVVERGESLNEWVARVAPDFVTSMFVLCHVTKRLQLLHSAGLCHRDLKPGNILWRPTANAWTLIDFGCAETIGAECQLLFSLHYAPPEVIVAASAGQRTAVADPKVDIWALGVVAFELLTGMRAFSQQADRAEVLPYMAGSQHLPWEAPDKVGVLRKLGVLRRTVLACLARNPQDRPTSTAVLRAWNGLFESETATRTGLMDDVPGGSGGSLLGPMRSNSLPQTPPREGSLQASVTESDGSRKVPALGQGGMRLPEAVGVAAVHMSPRTGGTGLSVSQSSGAGVLERDE